MNRFGRSVLVITVLSIILLAGTAFAAEASKNGEQKNKIGKISAGPTVMEWTPEVEHERLQLTVSTPWGEVWSKEFPAGKNPSFRIQDVPGRVVDGSYTWELRVVPKIHPQLQRQMEQLRASGDEAGLLRLRAEAGLTEELVESGGFTIANGTFVSPDAVEAGAGESDQRSASVAGEGDVSALTTISGDLTVYNSLCVGFDCATSEAYGADTIRLKENNVRIHFDDTSATGSFPSRDWRILVNDQANGGLNRFSIEDSTAGRFPFTIEGNAAANSLYVDDGGRVGFGTANPVVEMHSTNGDTPTLRLEQNGSSGFAAQTWDVAGNEANFFVRDVTGGSTLPFRIRPGAPTSSIDIHSSGNVGIGRASATSRLHVFGSDGNSKARIEETSTTSTPRDLLTLINHGRAQIRLTNNSTNSNYTISGPGAANSSLAIFNPDNPAATMVAIGSSGAAAYTLDVTGDLRVTGTIFGTVSGAGGAPVHAMKAGAITSAHFSGGRASVRFDHPYPNTSYAIALTPIASEPGIAFTVTSKSRQGFTVVSSQPLEGLVQLDWIATGFSERAPLVAQ